MQVTNSIRKVRGYMKAVRKMTSKTLKGLIPFISKANVQQMEIGVKPDGSFQPPYAPASIEMGKEPGPIKLKDTGAFHEGVFSGTKMKGENDLEIKSKDWKSDMLEKHYDPFGLTKENLKKVTAEITEELVKQLKEYFK